MSEADLVNFLHQTQYVGFELWLALAFFAPLMHFLRKRRGLKNFFLKLAWLYIKMNEPQVPKRPEVPKRKRNVRSKSARKKPLDKGGSKTRA